jgi:thiol-disulfide isomerase/thioredoxin
MRGARRPSTMIRFLIAAVAVAGLASPAAADIAVGDRAPELDIAKTEKGKAFRLKSYKGKWVFVTFGGSWCKPCAKELPAWDKMAPDYKKKVVFVAVNIDNDIEKGKKFNSKLKVKNLTKVYLPADKASGDDNYATGTFPSTFVIDPKGIVRLVHKGFSSGDDGDMKSKLDELLGE